MSQPFFPWPLTAFSLTMKRHTRFTGGLRELPAVPPETRPKLLNFFPTARPSHPGRCLSWEQEVTCKADSSAWMVLTSPNPVRMWAEQPRGGRGSNRNTGAQRP